MTQHCLPWFDLPSAQALCDSGAWQRGLALQRSGRVLALGVSPLREGWLLEGRVQGTQRYPYDVSLELVLMPDRQVDYFRSDCSCPVGGQCKHGVALLAQAALATDAQGVAAGAGNAGASTAADTGQPLQTAQQRRAALQHKEAQARLLHWLEALEQARVQAAAPQPQPGARPESPGRRDQHLYLASVAMAPLPPSAPLLQLQAVLSRPKVGGGWARPKRIRSPAGRAPPVHDHASDADRELLALLGVLSQAPSTALHAAYGTAPYGTLGATLQGQAGVLALQQAAATGRLFAETDSAAVGAPLQWGEALELAWSWQQASATVAGREGAWLLQAHLPGASATLCHNQPPLYLDAAQGRCGLVQAAGLSAAQLQLLLAAPPLSSAALQAHQGALLQGLGPVPLPPMLSGMECLAGQPPVARLHLAPTPESDVPDLGLVTAQLRFDYQGCTGWWLGQPLQLVVDRPQGQVLLQRDGQAEKDAIDRLFDLGLLGTEEGLFGIAGDWPQENWMHWADNGFEVLRSAGFALTLDTAFEGWITHAGELDVRLLPAGNGDEGAGAQGAAEHAPEGAGLQAAGDGSGAASPWFDLSLGVEINGQRHDILPLLPGLIAAAAAQPADPVTGLPQLPPFAYLRAPGRQGFVRLPTAALQPWMAALLELVGDRAGDFAGGPLRLSRLDALRAGAALGEGAVWQGAAGLRALLEQLRGHGALPEVPVPASVQALLRPYQQQGLNWLQFLRAHGLSGVLADDMGLGKTLQTLAHIQVEKDAGRLTHPALILAPVSLMGNWQREAARFCPELRTLVLHGKERHAVADSMALHDVVVAPYSLLQRDRARWLGAQWHLVVLDEAQHIKNASTQAAQVAGQLQARHRLCLSGTPMENHLGEVWSLFHFLMPGFLGSQKRFAALFRTPIEKQGNAERMAQLRARLAPFMLRRTKALVAQDLPPKIETVVRVALTGAQADLYETIRLGTEKAVRDALQSKGLARSQITILDALLKLRQVCCDPQLLALEAAKKVTTSAKLEQLMDMLTEMLAEGRRILLFSQFTQMLARIEVELKKRGLPWAKLTGQSQKRDAIIERFTSGEVALFLISLKAGGVGLNLPQADTVIHYDPWWNPAAEQQATDRAHRIGQAQKVWVLKLVAQDTIEERILALQERKAQLASGLYGDGAAAGVPHAPGTPQWTESDLAELLQPLPKG